MLNLLGSYLNIKISEVREHVTEESARDSKLRRAAGKSAFGGGLSEQLLSTRLRPNNLTYNDKT